MGSNSIGISTGTSTVLCTIQPFSFSHVVLDNQDLVDGLKIKVQLGSVSKASLTELSGGQWYAQLITIVALTTVSYPSPSCMYKGRSSRYR